MARVTLTEIQPGDAINLTTTNAMLTDILTKSVTIDDTNVRDGGLDERNINDDVVSLKPQASGDRKLFSLPNSSSALSFTTAQALPFQINSQFVVTGPFSFSSSSLTRLIVKFSCHYQTSIPAVASPTDQQWLFYMSYSTSWNGSTGTWTELPVTRRRVSHRQGANGVATANSLTIAHRFFESGISSSDDLYFGMFVYDTQSAGSDTITIEGANFYGIVL